MALFGPRYPQEIARRIPPGQRLVKTWPVLHVGTVPRVDPSAWDVRVFGLVEEPFTLTYAELRARYGAPGVSDEELLLRYEVGEEEVAALRERLRSLEERLEKRRVEPK